MPQTGLIFGGPSPEHDISILTGLLAAGTLSGGGQDPALLYWSKSGEWFTVPAGCEASAFAQGAPEGSRRAEVVLGRPAAAGFVLPGSLGRRRTIDLDCIVNCCHGGPGEDGRLQGLLDLIGVPYTGPSARTAALGMDKLAFGATMAAAGLPTLPRVALVEEGDIPFDGPLIVKPRFGGSSIGIAVVPTTADARALLTSANPHLRHGAVVEPYRPEMVDLYVNVRTYPALQTSLIEQPVRGGASEFLDYAGKYLGSDQLAANKTVRPADIPTDIAARVVTAAEKVADIVRVRGSSRLDFLWHGDDLVVNELNTIPGALGLYLWRSSNVPFDQLLNDMLAEARSKPDRLLVTAGSDGRALLDADLIKRKLS